MERINIAISNKYRKKLTYYFSPKTDYFFTLQKNFGVEKQKLEADIARICRALKQSECRSAKGCLCCTGYVTNTIL